MHLEEKNNSTTSSNNPNHYIVGIGFSAGGVEPLTKFFDHTPHDSASYIIVQHLPPDFKSRMAELLAKHSKLKILEITNNMQVLSNCVYLMPERKNITMKNGRLFLSETQRVQPNTAIDIFLDSLAADAASKSIAIILSGTGTDGTKGVAAIKKAGGLVIAQNPETALYDGMPNSVIDSGNANLILPPEEMPEAIMNYASQVVLLNKYTNNTNGEDEASLSQILDTIKNHTPLDFTNYKKPTILRRITRRMVQNNASSLKQYANQLLTDIKEIDILSKEFLISVTQFFRDTGAFEVIESTVLPDIIENKLTIDQLKIWVVGCATGEEAYSLAILIRELLTAQKKDIEVKIFATDVDKDAIAYASKGRYPAVIAKDVSAERLTHYFTKDGDFYKVKDELRKMVIFATHDIIKQPPYAKIDLISCRNLLIYLNPILQKKVLSTLHFCLNLNGYLFLGPSESIGQLGRFFSEEDKKWKIYKNTEIARTIGNVSYLSAGIDTNLHFIKQVPSKPAYNPAETILFPAITNAIIEETTYEAGVYIDSQFTIIQPWGKYESYLLPKRFNFNLIELLPEPLAVAVGTTVNKSLSENKNVFVKQINYGEQQAPRSVNILVKPVLLAESANKNAIVLFSENHPKEAIEVENESFDIEGHTRQYIADLEKKLHKTKLELEAADEIIQSYNDHAQAYNEELVSSNEEMQSTNEELQSINEELQTVNNEHQSKIKELADLNDDLSNYFKSSLNGQIFVDRNLIIKRYTPAIVKQINLIEDDIGRSLTNISTNVRFDGMIDDIAKVISEAVVCEREVQVKDGNWYQMIIKPYVRQQDNRIDGAVITFNDVTALKKAQEELIASNAEVLLQKNIELTKINRDLDGFIYTASHDLRSPIANMEGLLNELTQSQYHDDTELRPLFEMMQTSIVKLKKTILELTEISKIQKSIENDVQEIALAGLIEEVTFSIRDLIEDSKAKITFDLHACPVIKFSTKNLRSILYNLISNAIKYQSPERTPKVDIKTAVQDGYCILIVTDNGLGIKKGNYEEMFSMFKRFHDHVEGTGIGLYMVKRIVDNAGGKIEMESELDKGTTFKIFLKTIN